MFLTSNRLSELRLYFKEELLNIYPEREIDNIYFLINDVEFNRSKIAASDDGVRMSESEILYWNSAIKRLKKSEPVQYILGKTEFYNSEILVSSDVLIPRPETEELVDLILNTVRQENANCIDLGTGSGCIPIALKKAKPKWTLTGIDISKEALELAVKSAGHNEVEVKFNHSDIFSLDLNEEFDVIISNPPYIPVSDKSRMHENVYDYEPDIALFVPDEDPLLYYEAIVGFALKTLRSEGYLFFEIHEDLSEHVRSLLSDNGFNRVEVILDMQGKDRMVLATLNP